MKAVLLTVASLALSASVVANAYYQKKQFYPSVVYITKSNPSMAILYLQAFVLVILMGKLMRKVFFGQLRDAEMEHLIERSWYAVTETCLAFTVFRDDFSPRFVGLFTLLLFLKCFHWLAEDRIDYMERSPIIRWIFHIRAISLLGFLGILDLYFISHAYYSTLIKGASVQLVFGFEYAILFTVVMTVCMKYLLHTIDLQSENPWLNKAVYMLYTDLVLGFVKVVLYVLFLVIMIKIHTFPLFAIRPMYLTMRSFKKALNDVVMSRRAIKNMNTLYPDATEEELQSGDNVCIICREVMTSNSKKLPCNHIFHTNCLRSWFLRQQTCPTCRMDVLRTSTQTRNQAAPAAAGQGQAAGGQGAPPEQPPQAFFPAFPFGAPAWNQQGGQPQPPASSASGAPTASTSTFSSTSTGSTLPTSPLPFPPVFPPFGAMPPFGMGLPPFVSSPPMPAAGFSGLTEDELRVLEGQEREGLEARIQVLRNIHTLLDAAMIQMQQYTATVSSQRSMGTSMDHGNSARTTDTNVAAETHAPQSTATPTSSSSSTFASPGVSTTNVEKPLATPETLPKKPSSSTVQEDLDLSDLEGAVGFTPPQESSIPAWDSAEQYSTEDGELSEIRKRRLQRFSSAPSPTSEKKVADDIDLD